MNRGAACGLTFAGKLECCEFGIRPLHGSIRVDSGCHVPGGDYTLRTNATLMERAAALEFTAFEYLGTQLVLLRKGSPDFVSSPLDRSAAARLQC